MQAFTKVYEVLLSIFLRIKFTVHSLTAALGPGIGPKITQSVITAAFLFAFKDALYAASVQARKNVPKGLSLK